MSRPDLDIVETLDALDLDALFGIWKKNYGSPPPLRSPTLFRLMLAWRIQASIQGGLGPLTRKELARAPAPKAEGLSLGIGTKLGRIWKGRMVEVEVTENGFSHDGEIYDSLSAAATAIAGTRWNGPRFFGLREPKV
ncbi:DUF2924 domain-containing protein [Parasphingorhabdus sp.]|uniref:DUF2924 domain-containing protein n=1 Tax=Parasphingorhabdus sp. TaxID=2709688 RepID=UPI0030024C08